MCLLGLFFGLAILLGIVMLPALLVQGGERRRRDAAREELMRRRAKQDVASVERQTLQAMLAAELLAVREQQRASWGSSSDASAVEVRDEL